MKGWILSVGNDGQKVYRLEHGRCPFAIVEQMLYKGPGPAAAAAWGQPFYTLGQKTLAWVLAWHTCEDREMSLYLLPLFSQFLSDLRSDIGYFFSDDLLQDLSWEMQSALYANGDESEELTYGDESTPPG